MKATRAAMTPRTLTTLAAALAGLGALSIFGGVVLLGAGITRPVQSVAAVASAGEPAPADPAAAETAAADPAEGGLFARLRKAASRALPSASGNSPDSPGYTDGHPVGLYLMTRYWMTNHSLEKGVWYFTSGGRVYVDLEDGFSEDKLAAHKGRHGTITTHGGKMLVKWNDEEKSDSEIERDSSGFNWDMGTFVPVSGFTEASQLAGKWEGGMSLTHGGNNAALSQTLDLHADGTLTREAVSSFRSRSEGTVASVGSSGSTSGSWRLDGYSLILTYKDGTVVRGITFPFSDDKAGGAERFYFAGTMYKKVKG